jgi:uncharacterized membrane protein
VTVHHPDRGITARRRVTVSVLVGLIAGLLAVPLAPLVLPPLVAWDVAAVIYVGWVFVKLWHLDAEETARHAEREDPTRAAADLILICAAVASLGAVGVVIVVAGGHGGALQILEGSFAVFSVLASWAVIHTVFMLRYARLYYLDEDGGADFHQPGAPRYSDFAYVAFTVGMTYQVSDTELNTSDFRANVLRHALLSYLFGTVIVALVINLVAGLSR